MQNYMTSEHPMSQTDRQTDVRLTIAQPLSAEHRAIKKNATKDENL